MSTIVYQSNQSCFEPQFRETTTIRLKFAPPQHLPTPPKRHHHLTEEEPEINNCLSPSKSNLDMGTRSFDQAFTKENRYTNPMYWKSPSKLSGRSLELCTENLGSETGSDISESSMLSLSSLDVLPATKKPKERRVSRREKSCPNFPPPLTTLSGSNSRIQIRQHREGGRLIIEAMEAPLARNCLQAERSNGRLRLLFSNMVEDEESEAEEEEEEGESDANEEETEQTRKKSEYGEEDDREDMDGNVLNVGVKIGMEKFQRPSMCNESGDRGNKRGFYNWEPCWVASS